MSDHCSIMIKKTLIEKLTEEEFIELISTNNFENKMSMLLENEINEYLLKKEKQYLIKLLEYEVEYSFGGLRSTKNKMSEYIQRHKERANSSMGKIEVFFISITIKEWKKREN